VLFQLSEAQCYLKCTMYLVLTRSCLITASFRW
jgi:hypothetical protein